MQLTTCVAPIEVRTDPSHSRAIVAYGPNLPPHFDLDDEDDDDEVYMRGGHGLGARPLLGGQRTVMNRLHQWNVRSLTGVVTMEPKMVGSTYLTSVLETLYHYVPFRQLVLQWPLEQWMDTRHTGLQGLEAMPHSPMFQLQLLFAGMQTLEVRSLSLKALCAALKWDRIEMFRQHEVDAFLRHLFAALDADCVGLPSMEGRIDAMVRWRVRTAHRCKSCKAEHSDREALLCNLSLELCEIFVGPEESQVLGTLQEALQLFHHPRDTLTTTPCPLCGATTGAQQVQRVLRTPPLALVLLERFVFTPSLDRRSKIRAAVKVPRELHLSALQPELLGDSATLQLWGAWTHAGSSLDGMYSTLLQVPTPGAARRWLRFCDPDVEEQHNLTIMMESIEGAAHMYEPDETAYMLAYVERDARWPQVSVLDVSAVTSGFVKELHDKRASKKMRKLNERNLLTVRVLYEDQPAREFRVPGTTTMAQLEEQAAQAFGVAPKFARDHYRLRRWDSYNGIPRETFGTRQNHALATLYVTSDHLRLEVLPAHVDAFQEFSNACVTVKVKLYDARQNDFSPVRIFTIPSRLETLRSVRRMLGQEFGIATDHVRLFKETTVSLHSVDDGTVELIGDHDELYKFQVYDGAVLYLEDSDTGPATESACQAELERRKNALVVKYSFGDKTDLSMQLDRRLKVFDFKMHVAALERVDVDSLTVSQTVDKYVVLVRNEDTPLQDILVPPPSAAYAAQAPAPRLVVAVSSSAERTHVKLRVVLAGSDAPLFEGPVELAQRVAELREHVLAPLLVRAGVRDASNALQFRLRDVEAGELATMLADELCVRAAVPTVYEGKTLVVEPVNSAAVVAIKPAGSLLVSARRVHSDYTQSPVQELLVPHTCTLSALKQKLAAHFALAEDDVVVARCAGLVAPLDVPHLDWKARLPQFLQAEVTDAVVSAPLYLRDGDTLLVRAQSEGFVTLSDEQLGKLKGLRN